MVEKPNHDTEPRVQQLVIGSYRETGMRSQDLSWRGVLCAYIELFASYYQLAFYLWKQKSVRSASRRLIKVQRNVLIAKAIRETSCTSILLRPFS